MKYLKISLLSLLLGTSFLIAGASSVALSQPVEAAEKCGRTQKVDKAPDRPPTKIAVDVGCSGKYENPIYDYVEGIMAFLAAGVGIVVVGAIIFGGITYASARGDKAQVQKGEEIIRNAIIGLVLFIGMAAIINFIIPGGLL